MVRTQIYLTEDEREALSGIAAKTGRTRSELIREAVRRFVQEHQEKDRKRLLRKGRGLWEHRDDLPDFQDLRREWDQGPTVHVQPPPLPNAR